MTPDAPREKVKPSQDIRGKATNGIRATGLMVNCQNLPTQYMEIAHSQC